MDDAKLMKLSPAQFSIVEKIAKEAERQGVNPALAIAIAEAETGGSFTHYRGDKVLTSPAGAKGVMQIMPDTARLYNKKYGIEINPDDEDSNIMGGVTILKDLLTTYKSPRNAVALYNASPRAVATFMKSYETDPDKAIMSLPQETHNYSLRVSKNFNLDDDKETGLIPAEKESTRFGDYESESTKLKREQEAQAEADKNKPPPPPTPKTLLERASDAANEIDPATAAMAGAGINVAGPMLAKPILSPAEEAYKSAQDKLELARQGLKEKIPQGTENLEESFQQSQGELERIKNEQRLAQERLKGIPSAPPVIEPPAPSSLLSQIDLTKTGRASGPKVENDSGTRNWMIQEAGQKHQLPEVILDMATGKSKDSPTGGKALIDQDLANLEKIKQIGGGDYGLITTEGGLQMHLPPTTLAERQADIEKQNQASQAELEQRTEQGRIQQETQARLLEQQRALYEYEMERLRQQRAQAGQRHNIIAGQTKAAAPLQKALTKAEENAELARRKLGRSPEPTTPAGRVTANVAKTVGRGGLGAIAGAAGIMSYQEALERAKAGDTSEAVIKALEAGSAAAMLTPPVGKNLSRVRKAGLASGLGFGTFELGRRLLKDDEQQ